MTLRLVLTVLVTIAACGGDRSPSDRDHGESAARTGSAAPRPGRKLDMAGEVTGASSKLLATPLPGYADPKVGQWRAYRYITSGQLGTFHATAIAVVTAVTPTTVTVEFSGRLDETGEQRTDGADEFPRGFTVAHEIHRHHSGWPASRVSLTDEVIEVGGRAFPSKKLGVAFDDPLMPGKDTTVEVWLSPDVPAGGEVSAREVQKMPSLTITSVATLIGFGDADHTLWGKRPAGL